MIYRILITLPLILFFSNTTLDRSLIAAISKGDYLRVKKLVESGANVNYVYHKGKSALHWAAISGNLKIVAYLIYKGARIEATDYNGSTPLQLAAMGRNLDVVKLLVQSGANPEHKDKNGWSTLHYYVFHEFEVGVKYLLTQGVELTNKTKRKFLEIPEGLTPLDIAIKKNYQSIVNILENPIKYTSLSKKAILSSGISLNLGKDNFLSPLEKGLVILNLTNLGGGEATGLCLEVKAISNCEDIEIETQKFIDLGSAETKQVFFGVKGSTRMEKSGKAHFEMHIIDEERKTNVIPFSIEKFYKPIPIPFISALFHYPFEILTGGFTNLYFKIENKGQGEIEDGIFKIEFISTHIQNNIFEFSNINLLPYAYTNLSIKIKTIEDENIFENENVKARVIFSSLFDITNFFDFNIIPLSFPDFYSDYGFIAKSFTNLTVGETENPVSIFISNTKSIEGKNLDINLKFMPEKSESFKFNIPYFPANGVLNLYFPNDEYEGFILEIYYKKKLLFNKTYTLAGESNISK